MPSASPVTQGRQDGFLRRHRVIGAGGPNSTRWNVAACLAPGSHRAMLPSARPSRRNLPGRGVEARMQGGKAERFSPHAQCTLDKRAQDTAGDGLQCPGGARAKAPEGERCGEEATRGSPCVCRHDATRRGATPATGLCLVMMQPPVPRRWRRWTLRPPRASDCLTMYRRRPFGP